MSLLLLTYRKRLPSRGLQYGDLSWWLWLVLVASAYSSRFCRMLFISFGRRHMSRISIVGKNCLTNHGLHSFNVAVVIGRCDCQHLRHRCRLAVQWASRVVSAWASLCYLQLAAAFVRCRAMLLGEDVKRSSPGSNNASQPRHGSL